MCCCMAGALSAWLQAAPPSGANLQALLERMKVNMQANAVLAQQYNWDELWHNQNFDKNGKATVDESAKYENVFVEGLPHSRKVEENGKPLTGKAATEEEKRYEKALEERRHMSLEEKRGFFHRNFYFSLPLCCLTTLFENRVTGEETFNGRKMLVVESTPRADARPATNAEKSVLGCKQTTWTDEQNDVPVRLEAVALENVGHLLKGSTVRFDRERLNPPADDKAGQAVWVEQDFVSHFEMKIMLMTFHGITEENYSDYRKLQVDVRLLENSVSMLPGGQGAQRP